MTLEYELGTDIDRHWILNSEGDIQTISGKDNLRQAIYNRITCYFDNLAWCYTNYGSYVKDWFGRVNDEYHRNTLTHEIEVRVQEDLRIAEVTCTIKDYSPYYIGVLINGVVVEDSSEFSEYYIFADGTHDTIVDNYNETFHETHIVTGGVGYYSTYGNVVRVHCHVLDERNKRVPIGNVSLWFGGHFIDSLEIEQSGDDEPGSVTFNVPTPLYMNYGKHELKFRYQGKFGYNPCEYTTYITILEKLPTTTMIEDENDMYVVNNIDNESERNVNVDVKDVNLQHVNMGVVNASIDDSIIDTITITNPIVYCNANLVEEKIILTTKPLLSKLTKRYIFVISRNFKDNEVIRLIDKDANLIDNLIIRYINRKYYFTTTKEAYNTETVLKVYA